MGFQIGCIDPHQPLSFCERIGFVSFRKANPCTVTLKLAARGRDSACPVYAWGLERRVTFLLTSTSAGVAEIASVQPDQRRVAPALLPV